MTPGGGNTFLFLSSQQLPRLRLRPLKGAVSAQKAIDLPRTLPRKDTVKCAVLGAEVPGHCREQLMQTSIVRLLQTLFFHTYP